MTPGHAELQIALLGRMLKELRVERLDEIEHRITAQKKVYLLKLAGLDIGGYSFSWDLYGPFSSDLASGMRKYVSAASRYDQIGEQIRLTPAAQESLKNVWTLMEMPNDFPPHATMHWLEILCSVHFLAERHHRVSQLFRTQALANDPKAAEHIANAMHRKKPHLREFEKFIPAAWQRVRLTLISRQSMAA